MNQRRIDLAAPPLDLTTADDLTAAVEAANLVCFPTDTVYGVGGCRRPETVAAIAAVKGRQMNKSREADKPLQVIFATLNLLLEEVPLEPRISAAVRRLLPGPLTLVVPYPRGWSCPPPGEVGGVPTLGLRVPLWARGARLLAQLQVPLIASSANRAGESPPRRLADVAPTVLAGCDLVCDGGQVDGRASSVVDLSRYETQGVWRLLRAGAWDEARIASALRA